MCLKVQCATHQCICRKDTSVKGEKIETPPPPPVFGFCNPPPQIMNFATHLPPNFPRFCESNPPPPRQNFATPLQKLCDPPWVGQIFAPSPQNFRRTLCGPPPPDKFCNPLPPITNFATPPQLPILRHPFPMILNGIALRQETKE